jgi:hypothetical protein
LLFESLRLIVDFPPLLPNPDAPERVGDPIVPLLLLLLFELEFEEELVLKPEIGGTCPVMGLAPVNPFAVEFAMLLSVFIVWRALKLFCIAWAEAAAAIIPCGIPPIPPPGPNIPIPPIPGSPTIGIPGFPTGKPAISGFDKPGRPSGPRGFRPGRPRPSGLSIDCMLGFTARTFADVVEETGSAAMAPPRFAAAAAEAFAFAMAAEAVEVEGLEERPDSGGEERVSGSGRVRLELLPGFELELPLPFAGTAMATGSPGMRLREGWDGEGSEVDIAVFEEELVAGFQLDEEEELLLGSPNRLCMRFAPVMPCNIALFIRLLLLLLVELGRKLLLEELLEPEFSIDPVDPINPPLIGAEEDNCGTRSCCCAVPFPPVAAFPEAAELGRELSRELGLLGGSFGGEEAEPSRSPPKSPSADDAFRLSMWEYGERLPRLGRPVGGRPLWSLESMP